MIGIQVRTEIYARSELALLQVLKCLRVVTPKAAELAEPWIEQAFAEDAFCRLDFYARGGDGLAVGSLGVEYDREAHERQLRVCPEIAVDTSWEGGLAPDLQVASEYFRRLAGRIGRGPIKIRMTVRRAAWSGPLREAPPIIWAPGPRRSHADEVSGLPELTCTVRLVDNPA